jgi:hypothetical protein
LPLARLAPAVDGQARQWLTRVIEGEIARIRQLRTELAPIAIADAAEAPARLTYEIGLEGDKHRRYILSNERLVNRTVSDFFKARDRSETGLFELVSGPLYVVCCERETIDAPVAPIAAVHANGTYEPALVDHGDDGKSVEPIAGTNDADGEELEAEIDREHASSLLWDHVAMRAPIRAEELRKLNEECRTEAQEAPAAARRSRPRGQKNGTPAVRARLAPNLQGAARCDDMHFLRNEPNADGDDRREVAVTTAVLAVEDHGIDVPTQEKKRSTDEAPRIPHVDEAMDNGQRITGKGLSNEQIKAMHIARWKRKKELEIAQAARANNMT